MMQTHGGTYIKGILSWSANFLYVKEGAIRSDWYRALVRDMQKFFFIFSFLFKKAFACPLPIDR